MKRVRLLNRIDRAFVEYDAANPEVYRLFRRYARKLLDAGLPLYSADAILHRIRWFHAVNPGRGDGFKIPNAFSSRYARKLARHDPRFRTFFLFRKLRSKR